MDRDLQDQYILARSKLWTPELEKLLRKWKKQVGRKERGHRDLAIQYSRRHYILGLPTVILSTLITAGAFATFQECGECDDVKSTGCVAEVWVRLAVGILGMISIALTASVTFLNYQQTAEDHKSAADLFGERFREIDSMLQIPGILRGDPTTVLQSLRSQYDNDVRNAPILPKNYDFELTYDVINIKPPKPGEVHVMIDPEKRRRDTEILGRLLTENDEKEESPEETESDTVSVPLEKALEERNQYDTDEEQDVCIAFDLDAIPNINSTRAALAVAALSAKKQEQEQLSLQRQLQFELQRMEASKTDVRGGSRKGKRRKEKDLPNNRYKNRRKSDDEVYISGERFIPEEREISQDDTPTASRQDASDSGE